MDVGAYNLYVLAETMGIPPLELAQRLTKHCLVGFGKMAQARERNSKLRRG